MSRQPSAVIIANPALSTFVAKLAASRKRVESSETADTLVRSSAFSERPHPPPDPATIDSSSKRDDRLALVEDLELGPADHKPPFDDPTFEQLEPNSGIRLSCVFLLIHTKRIFLMISLQVSYNLSRGFPGPSSRPILSLSVQTIFCNSPSA